MRDSRVVRMFTLIFFYFCNACDKFSTNYCKVEQWAPWGSCNAICGGGVQERQRYICCDTNKYHSLKGCLIGCRISSSWWQSNAIEYKKCGNCSRGGTYDLIQNRCICPLGYSGTCCDVKTTTTITTTIIPTTTTISTSTTIPATTTIPTTTTIPATTTKPTTTTTSTISTSTTTTSITAPTTTTFTTSPTHKPTIGTTLLTTMIKLTTQSITKLTTTQKGNGLSSCVGNPCQHGVCIPMDHQYFCLCSPGYEGQNCDKDIDDCASGPCQYGTCHDKVDDFHCDCVFFFKGKMCNKLTSWAIAFIALASLAVLLTCCCCWWIMGMCNRDEEKTKVKPMKEKIKPKPTERQPRYDRW